MGSLASRLRDICSPKGLSWGLFCKNTTGATFGYRGTQDCVIHPDAHSSTPMPYPL
jgi:hypothetical protein